jgi:hypothetical protein
LDNVLNDQSRVLIAAFSVGRHERVALLDYGAGFAGKAAFEIRTPA